MLQSVYFSFVAAIFLLLFLLSTAEEDETFISNNSTSWAQEVFGWKPSEEIKRAFPVYVAGFSDGGNPVVFVEYGQWNISGYVRSKSEDRNIFYKRIKRLIVDFNDIHLALPDPDAGFIIILDAKNVGIRQLTSPPVLRAHMTLMRYMDLFSKHIERLSFINGSFMAEAWLGLVKPVAGHVIGKADVVRGGVDKISAFLSTFLPRTNFSEKYGGSPEFVPVWIL